MSNNRSTTEKVAFTAFIAVLMIPGLIIEPGPISEILGVAAIGTVWGVDLGLGGEDDG